jgi:hypothetical protein
MVVSGGPSHEVLFHGIDFALEICDNANNFVYGLRQACKT